MGVSAWSGDVSEALLGGFMALTETYYTDQPVNERVVVRWRHIENPVGASVAVELVDGEAHVGRMWIQRQEWRVGGLNMLASNPIDFLIREDHRKLPRFLSLFKSTMKKSHEISDFVIHSSNPLTDDLYRKLMKFEPCTELDAAVAPTRPFALLRAGKGRMTGRAGRAGDLAVQAMWRSLGAMSRAIGLRLGEAPPVEDQQRIVDAHLAEQSVAGRRSPEYRAWRFSGAGSVVYEQRWIWFGGRPRGYVVYWDRDVDGIRGRFVIDFVCPGRRSRAVVALTWLQVIGGTARLSRDAVFFFYNRLNRRLRSIASFPLVTVSRNRLPQRIPVFVRPSDSHGDRAGHPVDWSSGYYVLADFDMF